MVVHAIYGNFTFYVTYLCTHTVDALNITYIKHYLLYMNTYIHTYFFKLLFCEVIHILEKTNEHFISF